MTGPNPYLLIISDPSKSVEHSSYSRKRTPPSKARRPNRALEQIARAENDTDLEFVANQWINVPLTVQPNPVNQK
jgi:hypothetical protein